MTQQFGYSYGYQQPSYGYGQVAATPTAVGYATYQQRMAYPSGAQTSQPVQQPSQPQAMQTQPSVGYSPYTVNTSASAGSAHQQQHAAQYHTQQQQQQPKATPPQHSGTSHASAPSSSYYTSPSAATAVQHTPQQSQATAAQQAASAAAYFGYSGASSYARAQAPSYMPYYGQQQQQQQHQQQQTTQQQVQAQQQQQQMQQVQQQRHASQQQRHTSQQQQVHSQQSSMVTGSSLGVGVLRPVASSNQYSSPSVKTSSSSAAAVTAAAHRGTGYTGGSGSGSGGGAMVTYPAYTPTNYFSAYSKQTNQKSLGGGAGTTPTQTLTSQQQHVVASYIQQKNQSTPQSFFMRRAQTNTQTYYCEVCKISCACAATYKTHLEGKNHKKRLQQQQSVPKESKTGNENYCELCDVVCSNRDAFEAHVKGSKHQKVLTLHRRLGKPIPKINVGGVTTTTTTAGGKTVMVTAPRITFVGGQQLHSTGKTDSSSQQELKVYPPSTAVVAATPNKPAAEQKTVATPTQLFATPTQKTTPTPQKTTPTQQQATPAPQQTTSPQQATPQTPDDPGAEPVGEQFVVSVKGDTKVPHASYKCELCDCYFNDDYAKKMHVKGRRHRLNYKKTYQPDLYIEPTKSQKKEVEKKRQRRTERRSTDGFPPPQGQSSGVGAQSQASLNELRRQEAIELAKRRKQQQMMSEDFSRGPGPGPSSIPPLFSQELPPPAPLFPPNDGHAWHGDYGPPMSIFPPAPPRPHNPHDDKLVLSRHSLIYPLESEIKGVETVLADVEKALKLLSDDLLTERCKTENSTEIKKDEKLRELKGAYRVGSHAIGLQLRGECTVELVLMCANKPTHQLFNEVATRLPAKFESFNTEGETENIYNITPEPQKASLIIISQVGDHRIQVTVTFSSKMMRDESEEAAAADDNAGTVSDNEAGVLDRVPCLAALAALRHTTWFKTAASMLPSCTIVLRVLKDICHRVPAWGVLDSWMIELLVPKCITSANPDFTKPGDVFRRVMECVASGLFLPGGSGLCDPCENGVVDASAKLTAQERANITLSAQHALRLIAFGKLHLVLGVDPLPPPGTPKPHPSHSSPQQQQTQVSTDPPSKVSGDTDSASGAASSSDVTGGVKRESSEVAEEEGSEGVKKIKLES